MLPARSKICVYVSHLLRVDEESGFSHFTVLTKVFRCKECQAHSFRIDAQILQELKANINLVKYIAHLGLSLADRPEVLAVFLYSNITVPTL